MGGWRRAVQLGSRLVRSSSRSNNCRSLTAASGNGCGRCFTSAANATLHPQAVWLRTLTPMGPGQLLNLRTFADLPAHSELTMPSLSPTMNQGNIVEWKKKEGDELASGDILCMVETDKATLEWENQDDGFLAKILIPDGTKDIAVGTPVAVICDEKDDVSAFADYSPGGSGGDKAAAAQESQKDAPAESDSGESAKAVPAQNTAGSGKEWPPHTVMGLPSLSPTMSQGNIANWKKKEGDAVAAGDEIADIETDKATMGWEAQDEGFIAKILAGDGSKDIAVGDPVMVFVEEQGDVEAFKNYSLEDAKGGRAVPDPQQPKLEKKPKKDEPEQKQESQPQKSQQQEQKAPSPPKQSSGGRVIASPYAKKLAREAGVDISQAIATGPEGRIVAADVQKLVSEGGGKQQAQQEAGTSAQAPSKEQGSSDMYSDYEDIPNSQIRRITAKRLLESKQTIPHYYLTIDCRVDKLVKLRSQLNESLAKEGKKLSVNDFVIKASAQALKKVPGVNSSWHGEFIRQYHNIDISVAVQTPSGLMVPVIRDTDSMGLTDIGANVKALAGKAKEGKLGPAEMSGGTFTISNLGMYNVDSFSAVINPPQVAILAVGGSNKRVVVGPSGAFEEGTMMSVTLSCDHRVVDGAMGAQWLQAFRGYIEDPISMLL